jgi:phosphatidyl-myo-inositol dimannoside synthase
MNVVFTYLSSFSGTGGIERYNKCFMKALSESELDMFSKRTFISLNDTVSDGRYVNNATSDYIGCGGNKPMFLWNAFLKILKADTLVLGHINLSILFFVIRLLKPKLKCVLIIHGVEVWRDLTFVQKTILKTTPRIVAVSRYTAQTLMDRYGISENRITVINNMIDPFMEVTKSFEKPLELIKKHQLIGKIVLITVCRIRGTEKDKGYDKVLEVLPELLKNTPDLVYVLVGRYDALEKQRLDEICMRLKITDAVIFTGYVTDEELELYYKLADIFVMPSKKEGFGIVFIEALLNGLIVIAGNQDGSVDALDNGTLGELINPDDKADLYNVIYQSIERLNKQTFLMKEMLQAKTIQKFSFVQYKTEILKFIKM